MVDKYKQVITYKRDLFNISFGTIFIFVAYFVMSFINLVIFDKLPLGLLNGAAYVCILFNASWASSEIINYYACRKITYKKVGGTK